MQHLLVVYDYFSPAFKAGGPIQSLQNFTGYFKDDYKISVLTSAFDKGEKKPLDGITPNEWNKSTGPLKIYYWAPSLFSVNKLIQLFKDTETGVLYLNGLYSFYFNIIPLLFSKKKIVLAPRGMLHPGALTQKKWKKSIYFFLFKVMKWHTKVVFHATDMEEAGYIKKVFGKKVAVKIASNIPHFSGIKKNIVKEKGKAVLTSIALISPMKNIDLVLLALKSVKEEVEYHIYGPVKDRAYWKQCIKTISNLPANIIVHYHGEIKPALVSAAISNTHAFILPSKSENFGHAIFESFSCARPVITSNGTPWKNLRQHHAGWNVNTNTTAEIVSAVTELANMNQDDFNNYSSGAYQLANTFISNQNFKEAYKQLFSFG
jgi:glycosyltransferase involved in cell wall biosynthesis